MKKIVTPFNTVVFLISIFTGFLITYLSGSMQCIVNSENGSLENSVIRVANAFEIYNKKRFKE
ncbi:MAG: hypothetical protein M0R03_16825 [Novosphingobium sp.]|nr:hypothetical protein [Novosphingobium sp.]